MGRRRVTVNELIWHLQNMRDSQLTEVCGDTMVVAKDGGVMVEIVDIWSPGNNSHVTLVPNRTADGQLAPVDPQPVERCLNPA